MRWPGNVRELRNRMERAVALALGEWIMPADLFPELRDKVVDGVADLLPLAAVRDAAERRQIERALRCSGGQIAEAAARLGISRTTMWEKMRRHGIEADGIPGALGFPNVARRPIVRVSERVRLSRLPSRRYSTT